MNRSTTAGQVSLLGCVVSLTIRRFGPPGAFLVGPSERVPDAPTILLPGAEIPDGALEGEALTVFVYLDSEDRPVATVREPKVALGEVAFLTVTALAPFGAFIDWGLPKELLVPLGEQLRELHIGDRHPIGVYVDDTGRLAGTMRVSEMLNETAAFEAGEWVVGESWRKEPELGIFVIIEQKYVGMLPSDEPSSLTRGEAARFRVANVLPDSKVVLSLRAPAHEELENDAETSWRSSREPARPGSETGRARSRSGPSSD